MTELNVEVVEANAILAPFDPIEQAIEQYREKNAALVFNYDDPKDNKAARSHVFSMRQVKSQIAKVHRVAKDDFLRVSRQIDAKKNQLTVAIDEMIDVHMTPIKAIEEAKKKAEADRLQKIEDDKAAAERERLMEIERKEQELADRQAEIEAENAKRQAEMAAQQKIIKDRIAADEKARHDEIAKREAELKAREDKVREEEVAKRAREAAEIKALEDKHLAEERHKLELREQAEKLKKEQAERDAKLLAEKEAAAKKEALRVADVKHRKEVNNEVLNLFKEFGMEEDQAIILITSIAKRERPFIKIVY